MTRDRPGGQLLEPEALAVAEQHRRSGAVDVEDEAGPGHQPVPLSSRRGGRRRSSTRAAPAGGGGVLDRVLIARRADRWRRRAAEVGVAARARRRDRTCAAVADRQSRCRRRRRRELDLAVPQRREVELDARRHADEHDRAAGAHDGAAPRLIESSRPDAVDHDVGAAGELVAERHRAGERGAPRGAARSGSTTTSAPSSRGEAALLGVLGRATIGRRRGVPRGARRWRSRPRVPAPMTTTVSPRRRRTRARRGPRTPSARPSPRPRRSRSSGTGAAGSRGRP